MQLTALPPRWFGAFAAAPLLIASLLIGGAHIARAATSDFQEWHNKTEAENMAEIAKAQGKGYRIQSVAAYGSAGNERFATVVVRGTGENALQKVEMRSLAVPVSVTQVGTGWNIRQIAASGKRAIVVMEAGGAVSEAIGSPNAQAFANRNLEKIRANWQLVSVSAYAGSGGTSYYGVWEPNTRNTAWNADALDSTTADAQAHFDVMSKNRGTTGAGRLHANRRSLPGMEG